MAVGLRQTGTIVVETVAGAALDRTRLTGTEIEALIKPILELG